MPVLVIAIWLALIAPWFINTYKFTQCDFEAPYSCEAIHAAGLFGPISYVTVWFPSDGGTHE